MELCRFRILLRSDIIRRENFCGKQPIMVLPTRMISLCQLFVEFDYFLLYNLYMLKIDFHIKFSKYQVVTMLFINHQMIFWQKKRFFFLASMQDRHCEK
ncbi:MAG: hypothetical protein A2Y62_04845 [Candidatus Fischerbacteria bacterium RBG_13_37_8]|uniref:Uncharacterized protein n=1 Tax=Candidatus Fischerbacteria bacterium RBG_13_37_8 TaxID=1817863 RepID=A0A1F5VHT5_9BACT|nr:MAG: hypothetical protein A2Y62_04845 [Candidatus Fischerbacteria bacterium RBG_13_37_8]